MRRWLCYLPQSLYLKCVLFLIIYVQIAFELLKEILGVVILTGHIYLEGWICFIHKFINLWFHIFGPG